MSMRSWRRGTKEMDLVLGPWADAHLARLLPDDLARYDLLLEENDQDLMAWVMGQDATPDRYAQLLGGIAAFAKDRLLR